MMADLIGLAMKTRKYAKKKTKRKHAKFEDGPMVVKQDYKIIQMALYQIMQKYYLISQSAPGRSYIHTHINGKERDGQWQKILME